MPPTPSDQPIYARIAADLRRQIDAGTLGGALPLPSDASLMDTYRHLNNGRAVSRNSVRQALSILRSEGRIYTVKGRGSYVTPPMPSRVISMDRYRDELAAALAGERPSLNDPGVPSASVSVVDADEELCRLFNLPPGLRVFRRDWTTRIDRVPAQLTTSYYLADLVSDPTDPLLKAGGGVMAYLVSAGIMPSWVREVRSFRPATAAEAETFPMAAGWVVSLTRQIYAESRDAGRQVVEVAREIVLPAKGTYFEQQFNLAEPKVSEQ